MAEMVITIDGPASSGKSTMARLLAKKLGATYLDTGAMYRAVTVAAIRAGVRLDDEEEVLRVMEGTDFRFRAEAEKMFVFVNGEDVTEEIRSGEVTEKVHYVASAGKLRGKLVEMQRRFAAGEKRIITEGRDQGTVVFGDADVKFFLTAEVKARARRRWAELAAGGEKRSVEEIEEAIIRRDTSDRERAVGPLKAAADAIAVDTTNMSIEQTVEVLVGYVRGKSL